MVPTPFRSPRLRVIWNHPFSRLLSKPQVSGWKGIITTHEVKITWFGSHSETLFNTKLMGQWGAWYTGHLTLCKAWSGCTGTPFHMSSTRCVSYLVSYYLASGGFNICKFTWGPFKARQSPFRIASGFHLWQLMSCLEFTPIKQSLSWSLIRLSR